jgi:putative spermidine/putrescine transport system permease protein
MPAIATSRAPFDRALLLAAPATLFMLLLFVYPFLYGLGLSFAPTKGDWLTNYRTFFTTDNLWQTIGTTLKLAMPATIINVGIALPIAFMMRVKSRYQRFVTTLLVVPITLGTVLIAEGMLTYFGPKGWLSQFLQLTHLYDGPIRLTHNYWGVLISLVISGFPFAFLLILSYITGIDPVLARAASTLGASPAAQFRHIYLPLLAPGLAMCFCLAFVQAFSVFPSAVLLGAPAGPTRVISIAAYEAAFEQYDYSLASAIAMIMGFVQLVIVAIVLGLRGFFYRGPVVGGKG